MLGLGFMLVLNICFMVSYRSLGNKRIHIQGAGTEGGKGGGRGVMSTPINWG